MAQVSSPAEAYVGAADARSVEDSAPGAEPRCAVAVAPDGSAAGNPALDGHSARDGSRAPLDSVPDGSSRAGGLTAEADSVPHGWADYSAAPTADDHSVPVAHSGDSVPDDYSPAVDSAATGSEDYSAAPPADDHFAPVVHSADSVPDDYSLAVGSVAAGSEDYSAAPMADDHSAPVVHSADSVPDDCLAEPVDSAASGPPVAYSAVRKAADRSASAARSADSVPDDYSLAADSAVGSAAAGSADYSAAQDSSPDVHSLPADFPAGFPADFLVGSAAVHSPVDLQDEPEAEPPACSPSPRALAPVDRVRWLAAVSASPAGGRTPLDAAPAPAVSLRTTAAVEEAPSSQSLAGSPLPPEGPPRGLPCWSGLQVLPPVQAQPPLANSSGPTQVAADPPARLRDLPAVR